MGLFDVFSSELIDIIEWVSDDHEIMVHRFERHKNEIKYGAKLLVREGQMAVFINEGQAQLHIDKDTFEAGDAFPPGTYTLETKNLPILSTLKGWKYGFESPFKAEVYFINTTRFTNQKWGTPNPIMLRDKEFGPVRLRAFGNYSLKIEDPALFLREIVGTDSQFSTEEIADELRNIIITRFTDVLGESGIPVLDLAANYNELSQFVSERMGDEFKEFGLKLTKLLISNISLPPAVSEAMDKRSSMGILGNLNQYSQYQAAEAMGQAANNPGSMGSDAMAMGASMAMAQQMAQNFQQPQQQQQAAPQAAAPAAPPPPPPALAFHVAVNGQTTGPFDMGALQQQVQSGQLSRQSMVWKQGMSGWIAAADVPELASLFAAVPPPPPPM